MSPLIFLPHIWTTFLATIYLETCTSITSFVPSKPWPVTTRKMGTTQVLPLPPQFHCTSVSWFPFCSCCWVCHGTWTTSLLWRGWLISWSWSYYWCLSFSSWWSTGYQARRGAGSPSSYLYRRETPFTELGVLHGAWECCWFSSSSWFPTSLPCKKAGSLF